MRWMLLLAVISGCGTSYGPAGFAGGYQDHQINERTFDVACAGNGFSSPSFATNCAMRRAAEIAVSRGFAGFTLAQEQHSYAAEPTGEVDCTAVATSGNTSQAHCRERQGFAKPAAHIIAVMQSGPDAAGAVAAGQVVYDAGLLLTGQPTIPPQASAVQATR